MLEIIEYGKDQYEFPALIVLGCFDAIHVGHKELLKKAKLQAKINGLDLGVMTFRDGKSGKLLYSLDERIKLLEEYNVKFILAIDFNDEFKKIAPLDFLAEIEDKINVKGYMSGKDFRFGAGAKGKASTLKNYAEDDENGVWYMNVKDVDYEGTKISTTLIKSCLDEGDVEKAAKLLGREYSLTGEVVKGAGRGTSVVGYPTVNIVNPDWKYPVKFGVYNVSCEVDGTLYHGVANFGTCPTFGDERVALETYLEGYEGDLYGKTLTVNFISYIRDIEKFSSAEELSAQVKADIDSTCPEEPVKEAVEEPTEEAVVEATEVPTEETVVEAPVEEATEEIVVEAPAVEEVIETPVEEPVEEVNAEEVVEEPVEEEANAAEIDANETAVTEAGEVVEETTEEPAAEVVEEEVEETPVEEAAEEPVAEAEENIEEAPSVEATEETVEEVTEEIPAEETVVEPVEEEVAEVSAGEPTEEAAEELIEEPVEEVTEEPAEETQEVVEEAPVEEETAVCEECTEENNEDKADGEGSDD